MTSLCPCNRPAFEKVPEVAWCCVQCWTQVPKDEELQDPSTREEVRPCVLKRSSLNLSWPRSVEYNNDNDLADEVVRILEESVYSPDQIINISHPNDRGDSTVHPPMQNTSPVPYKYYQYQSLDAMPPTTGNLCIRILQLSKGEPEDPLHGRLVIESVDTPPKYEAISYMWANEAGDSVRRRPLYLENNWYRLPITENCAAVLRRFRDRTKSKDLWIDSVCINQGDADERREQVGLMPEIYSRAQKVLVYLGEGSKSTSDAMFALNSDKKSSQGYVKNGHYFDEIKWLFSRPYFSRIWIIQELALARDASFYHGYDTQSLELYHSLDKIKRVFKEVHPEKFLPRWLQHCGGRKLSSWEEIVNLIFDGTHSEASRPEDKIFAFFGMMDGASMKGLVANYNIAVEQVYTGIATFLVSKGHLMNLLERVSGGSQAMHNNRPLDLPSWVPDFRCAAYSHEIHLSPRFRPVYIQPDSPDQRSQPIPEVVLSRTGSLVIHGHRILKGINIGGPKRDVIHERHPRFELMVEFQRLFDSAMDIIMLPCIKYSKPYALHLRKIDSRNRTNCYTFIGLCKVGLFCDYADSSNKKKGQPGYFSIPNDPETLTVRNFLKENSHLDTNLSSRRLRFFMETKYITSNTLSWFPWALRSESSQDLMNRLTKFMWPGINPMGPGEILESFPSYYDKRWYQWLLDFYVARSAATKCSRDLSQRIPMFFLRGKIQRWWESSMCLRGEMNRRNDYTIPFGEKEWCWYTGDDYPCAKEISIFSVVDSIHTVFCERGWEYFGSYEAFDPIFELVIKYIIGDWGNFMIPLSQVHGGEDVVDVLKRMIVSLSNLELSYTFISGSREEFIII